MSFGFDFIFIFSAQGDVLFEKQFHESDSLRDEAVKFFLRQLNAAIKKIDPFKTHISLLKTRKNDNFIDSNNNLGTTNPTSNLIRNLSIPPISRPSKLFTFFTFISGNVLIVGVKKNPVMSQETLETMSKSLKHGSSEGISERENFLLLEHLELFSSDVKLACYESENIMEEPEYLAEANLNAQLTKDYVVDPVKIKCSIQKIESLADLNFISGHYFSC